MDRYRAVTCWRPARRSAGPAAGGRRPSPASSSRTSRPAGCGAVVRVREDGRRRTRRRSRTGTAGTGVVPARPGLPGSTAQPVDLVAPGRAPAAARAPAYGLRVGRRARRAGPGRPRRAGSASRAGTTPSWSRRSGATTCASRASSSSSSTASTTCRPSCATSRPGPGAPARRARRPPRPRHQGVAGCAAQVGARRTCWSLGHPYVDVWQAVRPAALGHRRLAGDPARHAVEGGRLRRPRLAARPGRRRRAGGGSCAPVTSYADLEPSLLGRVEELIDFVTAPAATP